MPQEIIDIHTHCFTGRQHAVEVHNGLEMLKREGLRHMVVVGLVNTVLDSESMWNLMPRFVENRGDPLFNEAADLLDLATQTGPVLLPFVDTRHLWGKDVSTSLSGYIRRGFMGIKGIYLADDGNDLGVGNVPDTLGITLAQYQRREWEIFAFAQDHDLPIVYHMDARRYGELMKALMEDFPNVRVDFAHFGIGRNAFRMFMDRYPNVFTDIASLLPHIKANPSGYRDFIMHYDDRICFGSDAYLYAPHILLDYIHAVRELRLPEEVESKVLSENPRRFLGRLLPNLSSGGRP